MPDLQESGDQYMNNKDVSDKEKQNKTNQAKDAIEKM